MLSRIAAAVCLFGGAAIAQQQAWGQCGGINWTGGTTCVSGYVCTFLKYGAYVWEWNRFLTRADTSTASAATRATSTRTGTSTTLSTVTTTGATTTTTGAAQEHIRQRSNQGTTYWIRAVASPNYHSYLQAAPTATPSPGPGDAYLLSAPKAGQFNIIDGQLVYNPGSPSSEKLYMWVEDPANKMQRTLETWFDAGENPYGKFAFQGDTLTWAVDDIKRPNAAAWLVCGDAGQLYINTGAYAYDTPEGCADQTIHSYGGSTADV
ncbi:carbohydrate-binding module family 1 protein [Xylaria bambusicola]|uniref:carbohydrate-binding module family 1 protein n=1 Tax=Xylaria bambusicola TaxID=326684 RepID=UPI0020075265|nr:carbohydrate-binding module family 1 protein [Xylaria bambusicola]KAI0506692.1 carbohydrate-binding module family 1 protein [Xylaria bambusicola]